MHSALSSTIHKHCSSEKKKKCILHGEFRGQLTKNIEEHIKKRNGEKNKQANKNSTVWDVGW